MKKKLIIGLILLLVLGSVFLFCSTRRINLSYDSDGNLVSKSGFTVKFSGSEKYTDKELAEFLFPTEKSANPFVFWWTDKFGEHVEIPFIEAYDVELKGLKDFEVTFYEKSLVGYIEYMGSYKYFDKDGIVVESSSRLIEDVPFVTGIDVDYIVLHSKLPVEDEQVFDLLLDLTQLLYKYDIDVEKINISKGLEIKLYLGNVRVELGTDENLSEKIMDLKDIMPNLGDASGTLDMKVLDVHGNGYTLKRD